MPSSKRNVRKSPTPSTAPQKDPDGERRADELAAQAIANLRRIAQEAQRAAEECKHTTAAKTSPPSTGARTQRPSGMSSSNPNAPKSPTTSTKPPKAPGLEERGEQLLKQALDNLNRARREEEAAKRAEERKSG